MWLVVVRDKNGKICAKMPLANTPVTIGRSKDRSIVLDSRSVSRTHGRFELRGSEVFYVDEGSANGSLLDGKPVHGAAPITELSMILLGDDFRIGVLNMRGGKTEKIGGATMELPASRPAPITQDMGLTPMAPRVATPAAAPPPSPPSPPPPRPAAQPQPPPDEAPTYAAPRPAPGLTPPVPGMQFKIPDTPAAGPRMQAPGQDRLSDSMANLLDQQIRGIQSQRSEREMTQRTQKEIFEQGWKDAITAARDLQGRLKGNNKVLYYVISRDELEVSAKIMDGSKRGFCNLILSKRHPDKGNIQDGVVWFGEFGDEPRAYREPKDALEDFVRRIAGKLA